MQLLSFSHLFWMLLALGFAFFSASMRKIPLHSPAHRRYRWTVLGTLVVLEIFWSTFRHFVLRVPWKDDLPLHISDFAILNTILALATLRLVFADIAYFIGCFGVSLAILFPHISESGWPLLLAVPRFFLTHVMTFGAGFYLTIGRGHYPDFRRFLRVYSIVMLYALCLIPLNRTLGTNYFFTVVPPAESPSWGHSLPQWQYSLGFAVFFFIPYFILWLPMAYLQKRPSKTAP